MRTLHWLELHLPARVWNNLASVSILGLLIVLGVFAYKITDLNTKNAKRIHDIQQSRVSSCRTTYDAIEDVALFFFPPPGKRDASQQRIASNLHVFIGTKKAGCMTQTKPRNGRR